MNLRCILFLPLFALSATAAMAEEGAWCRNGLFPNEKQFAVAKIGGKERAYFFDDTDGCPTTNSEDCRTGSYVLPGDELVISRITGRFACAFFPSDRGGTAGWIEKKRLFLQPRDTRELPEAWLGRWSSSGNPVVRFRKDLGALSVTGQAFWPGPPGTHDWPSTHEGAIAGHIELSGNKGFYRDDNLCEVNFTLLGDYLVASDNRQCGGANISFSGVYARR